MYRNIIAKKNIIFKDTHHMTISMDSGLQKWSGPFVTVMFLAITGAFNGTLLHSTSQIVVFFQGFKP